MPKAKITNPDVALTSWTELNEVLQTCDEKTAEELLYKERYMGRCRLTFMLRIHSRINKLRADREREELTEVAK